MEGAHSTGPPWEIRLPMGAAEGEEEVVVVAQGTIDVLRHILYCWNNYHVMLYMVCDAKVMACVAN